MRFLVQGYYGRSNFGDDLLLKVVISKLNECFKGAEFRILSDGLGIERLSRDLGLSADIFIPVNHTSKIVSSMHWADVLLWGGGTCLHDSGFCGFWRNLLAKAMGCKVVWIGIGMDHLVRIRSKLKANVCALTCDLMILRDSVSLTMARKAFPFLRNVHLAEDLVWLHSLHKGKRFQSQKELVVTWRDFSKQISSTENTLLLIEIAKSIIDLIHTRGLESVKVVNLAGNVDFQFNLKAAEILREEIESLGMGISVSFLENPSINEALHSLQNASLVISGRMHPFIVAKLFGVPSLPIVYATKVDTYAHYFSNQSSIDITKGNFSSINSNTLYKQMVHTLDNYSSLIHPIEELKKKAELNFKYLVNLLNN